MNTAEILNPRSAEQVLDDLPDWQMTSDGKLQADYQFHSFPEAFSFMTRVAFEAERIGHHPDWSNSYNKVHIELSTHDLGGVTEMDLKLARKISEISWV